MMTSTDLDAPQICRPKSPLLTLVVSPLLGRP